VSRMLLITAALVTSGCFVPPPLELEADGGGSSAPTLLPGSTTPDVGKPFTWEQKAEPRDFNLALYDPDSPTLYVRAFIDGYPYSKPVGSSMVDGCSEKNRFCGAGISVVGLCDEQVNNVLGPHLIEFWVADLEWDDTSTNDLRRTVAGGFTTSISWRFDCI